MIEAVPSEEIQQQYDRHWHHRARTLGIPDRRVWASIHSSQNTPALARMRRFLQHEFEDGRCLSLLGPTGVGKSYAAVAALRWYAEDTSRGWFYYFPKLCAELMDQDRREHALGLVTTWSLVVFDDFGVEYLKSGGFLDALIDEIIWTREGNTLATIITTNLTEEQLRDRLSDRIVDRLAGDWGSLYAVPGKSLRGQGRAKEER